MEGERSVANWPWSSRRKIVEGRTKRAWDMKSHGSMRNQNISVRGAMVGRFDTGA